ncbi:MAG: 4-hydroxy-tetrahydrodipicolinate synthase [Clostridia bacterium]|nr:4-hydroxy-tetrahydrodipicolinate synthase [Clostridiales bacterium]MDD7308039.1 4-hydroxy-tetrahydrodipicolinate synthase [Eubacteriales bacterium]MDO4351855.1 4-hydroxy-tetrahydrodipicolinate synthase [Clostridia bacterium]MDY2933519.1 4-hydroxy-tetrahydrodipicolinate synthase [Anaerovoracaceae bacterium]MEE0181840.1 4-hydroxy-tetrahydrodipicolinate synthase [Anaerovoracaceae bacterium]
MKRITGSIVALITPFTQDGKVNYEKLGELLDWHIANNTDAILILGTTSESPTMSHEEDLEICRFSVERVAGRVPVIASSGSNSTQTVIEKSLDLQAAGADAVMNIAPYYNKANKKGMYHHFADVADAIDIPLIIYNVPGRTGCSIPADVIGELSKHERIIGIKEASGDLSYVAKIAKYANENFAIYSGNDDVILPVLSMGGSGVISVLANVMPKETHDMVMSYLNGDTKGALAEQLRLMNLINNLFIEVNPIPVKEAMNLMGMNVGGFRLPLCEMEDEHREILRESMAKVGLV